MTTEEKLEHFQSFCIQDARKQSNKLLEDYNAQLQRQLNDHKEEAQQHAAARLQIESEKITQESNKKLAVEQIVLKRVISQKHEELKKKLFVEVHDLLENYMSTVEYEYLLKSYIQQALALAGTEELIIYMDPVDQDRVLKISMELNVPLKVSEYSFLGGIRAVIPSKNILIDHSFASKLEECEGNFQFRTKAGGSSND